jgi:hypothetical protein
MLDQVGALESPWTSMSRASTSWFSMQCWVSARTNAR